MTTTKPAKVLCSGDVQGKFTQLINRVSAVNKKCGPFDALLCVGEFFGPNDGENKKVINGEVDFPVPTYILGPCSDYAAACYPEESVELSPNLTYLGKKGILNTAAGLSIGYLSGVEADENDEESSQKQPFEFDEADVDEMLIPVRANSNFLGLDILLTSMWPAQVTKHSSNQPSNEVAGSKALSRLATGLKPRYHFAGCDNVHYERSPYRNHRVLIEPQQHVTRFIGLSSVENAKKEKWLYAFNLVPMRKLERKELTAQPDNTSEFPYMDVLGEYMAKRQEREAKMRAEQREGQQYFFDMGGDPNEYDPVDRGGRRRRKHQGGDNYGGGGAKRPQQLIQPDTCWFCLSNVGTEKHLVVSIGEHCYAAMPKGPLTDDHVLLMSIGHVQSVVAATPEIRGELAKFRDAFALLADKQDKVLCLFERNYKTSHLQLQLVPVPKRVSKALRSCFLNAANLKNIEFLFLKEGEEVQDCINEGSPYFYVELPDGTKMLTRSMSGFPIQFGREVLAGKGLLNCEEKIDWRNCVLDPPQEAELVEHLKLNFKPFDFTADDEEGSDDNE